MSRSKRNKKKRKPQGQRPKQQRVPHIRARPYADDEYNLFKSPVWLKEVLRNAVLSCDTPIGVADLGERAFDGKSIIRGDQTRWRLFQQIQQEFLEEIARGGRRPEFYILDVKDEVSGRVMRDIITFDLDEMPEHARNEAIQAQTIFPNRLYKSNILMIGGIADGASGYIEGTVPSIPEILSPADGKSGLVHHYRNEESSKIDGDVVYVFDEVTQADGTPIEAMIVPRDKPLPDVSDVLSEVWAMGTSGAMASLEDVVEVGAPRLPGIEPLRAAPPVIPDAPAGFTDPSVALPRTFERKTPGEILEFETSNFLHDGFHANGIPYYQAVCPTCGEKMPKRRLHWVDTEAEKFKEYFDAQTRALKDLLNHEHNEHPEQVTEARKREILREYDRLAELARTKIRELTNV